MYFTSKNLITSLGLACIVTGSAFCQESNESAPSKNRNVWVERKVMRFINNGSDDKNNLSSDDVSLLTKKENFATCKTMNKRPFLGVILGQYNGDGQNQGVEITDITKESAAEKGGIQKGDILVSLDGKKIQSGSQVSEIILSKKSGDNIVAEVIRNGEHKNLTATLGEKTENIRIVTRINKDGKKTEDVTITHKELGKEFAQLDPRIQELVNKELANVRELRVSYDNPIVWVNESETSNPCEKLREMNGTAMLGVYISTSYRNNVFVENTIHQMGAEVAGLQKGDVISAIDGTPVKNYTELRKAVTAHKPGERVAVTYKRNGEESMMHITLSSLAETRRELVSTLEKRCAENPSMPKAGTEQSTTQMTPEAIAVNPNPTSGLATVRFNSATTDNISVAVTDMEGREVMSSDQPAFVGTVEVPVDLTELPKGIYFVNITQNGQTHSQRIIVQ